MFNSREAQITLPIPEAFIDKQSPEQIIKQTGTLIPMVMDNSLYDKKPAREFFKTATFELIEDAAKGFFISKDVAKTNHPLKTARTLIAASKAYGLTDRRFENERINRAYTLSRAIFYEMPTLAHETSFTPDISITNGLILQPPENPSELLIRFSELRKFVAQLSEGYISHVAEYKFDDATLRGFAFFQVGKDMIENPKYAI